MEIGQRRHLIYQMRAAKGYLINQIPTSPQKLSENHAYLLSFQGLSTSETKYGVVCIGRPTAFEVESGLLTKNAYKQLEKFHRFVEQQIILEITQASAQISAKLYAHLASIGKHSGVNDLYLAGIAQNHQLAICTNNEKDYENIPDLEIVNWAK